MDRAGIGHRLLDGAHIGLGNDLQQRGTGPVEVDAAHAVEVLVQGFPRILLQVRPGDADHLLAAVLQIDGE